jgi:hypothetical protein
MRAWIDRTNDGLSGMPADGISLPPKKGTSARPAGLGSKVRLHQLRDWAEGGMTALGKSHQFEQRSTSVAFGARRTLTKPRAYRKRTDV